MEDANNPATNPGTENQKPEANQAQPAAGTQQNANNQQATPQDWTAQLDEILNKRLDGIAKSILKSNGVEDADIGDILKQYHAGKKKATDDAQAEHTRLADENKALRAQILEGQVQTKAAALLEKVGANAKYLTQVLKLADLTEATKDGKIDEAKLEAALKKVVDDCDAFKTAPAGNNGFQNVGAKKNEPEAEDETARIRRVMGLPPLPKN